eukprot:TRINITY_DN1125_c0_g1_i18.p2 TRINITY_DN1125_c0_g1~~TRINITY_DN1125_c0_g1_i18.p2  ORF type:complete len:110 (-),score=18.71 TRINITY_DN1125_c0_g1_i18:169-498(-)
MNNAIESEEIKDLTLCPTEKKDEEPNYFNWEGIIDGPAGSPYEGASIKFKLAIPPDYPFSPPSIVFSPPLYHPMVIQSGESAGHTCFEMLAPKVYKTTTSLVDSTLFSP